MLERLFINGRQTLSSYIWSISSRVQWLDLPFSAVGKLIDAPAPSAALPSPFVMANAEALKKSFSHARFKDTKIETLKITFDFVHPESYTRSTSRLWPSSRLC
jgi:hypothetical protein